MNETLKQDIANRFRNTELGYLRIKENLNIKHLSNEETEKLIKQIILSTNLDDIEIRGKNFYFTCFNENAILTVNSYTFTIITAKQITIRKIREK